MVVKCVPEVLLNLAQLGLAKKVREVARPINGALIFTVEALTDIIAHHGVALIHYALSRYLNFNFGLLILKTRDLTSNLPESAVTVQFNL